MFHTLMKHAKISHSEVHWLNKTKAVKNVKSFTICSGLQAQIILQLEFNFLARSL